MKMLRLLWYMSQPWKQCQYIQPKKPRFYYCLLTKLLLRFCPNIRIMRTFLVCPRDKVTWEHWYEWACHWAGRGQAATLWADLQPRASKARDLETLHQDPLENWLSLLQVHLSFLIENRIEASAFVSIIEV